MWAYDSVFYQIYPLGFCGAPPENGTPEGRDASAPARIRKIIEWLPHIRALNANALYLSPVWESDSHGYDTRDFTRLDRRLGKNEDFAAVCRALHESGVRVVLDGVFHHVGRGFWAFRDVLEKREASAFCDWFFLDFSRNSAYGDGFWYEGWEGHYELVKLNLRNEAVTRYLFDCIRLWVEQFDIDGLRLDVAYCLDREWIGRLRAFCAQLKPAFFLVGEMIHGDYRSLIGAERLHSVTNYECYKGLYSSFNSGNLFEIAHSLGRQFGPEEWTLYKGLFLFNFVDNHDVTRIATLLNRREHLPLIYSLLFSIPGIPCVYYGSEWGAQGDKAQGDSALRPAFREPEENGLFERVAAMALARRESRALCCGNFRPLHIASEQLLFERAVEGERVIAAVNAADHAASIPADLRADRGVDLLTGTEHTFSGGISLPPVSAFWWRTNR